MSDAGLLLELKQKIEDLTNEVRTMKVENSTLHRRIWLAQTAYLGGHLALTNLDDGSLIYVDTRSADIGSHLMLRGVWEPEYVALFRRIINPGNTVFDIGMNHGVYTLAGARATGPSGIVYAFEPNPGLFDAAELSASVNGFSARVKMYQVAAGHENGEADLEFDSNLSGGGSLFRHTPGAGSRHKHRQAVPCKVVRIDDLLPSLDLHVDVMKMDIEGYEGCALKGMARILDQSPNIRIIMEWSLGMMDSTPVNAQETAAFLSARGFKAWRIAASGQELTPVDWHTLATTRAHVQNVAVSRGEFFR